MHGPTSRACAQNVSGIEPEPGKTSFSWVGMLLLR